MHPPPISRLRLVRAMTLVEVLVAMVVALIAVIGLLQALTVGSNMLDVAKKQTVATQILRTQIEQVRLKSWTTISGLPLTQTTLPPDSLYIPGSNEAVSVQGYTVTRTVAQVGLRVNFRQITFTVTWTDNLGRTYTRSAYTYCSKNGVNALYQR